MPFFSQPRNHQYVPVFIPRPGVADPPEQTTSGFFVGVEDFLNQISQREIGMRDNAGDSGLVFWAFLTFLSDFSYKFGFTNGFQVFGSVSPVT